MEVAWSCIVMWSVKNCIGHGNILTMSCFCEKLASDYSRLIKVFLRKRLS